LCICCLLRTGSTLRVRTIDEHMRVPLHLHERTSLPQGALIATQNILRAQQSLHLQRRSLVSEDSLTTWVLKGCGCWLVLAQAAR
jgi:hypothetical protein